MTFFTQVFSFNGIGRRTKADMFDAVSILCSNGATVTVSGVAAIPGDNKVIENRLVGTDGYLTFCGNDEDKGKTSLDEGGYVTQITVPKFELPGVL